jgi:membrane protease YdiL (CAAX protease family)
MLPAGDPIENHDPETRKPVIRDSISSADEQENISPEIMHENAARESFSGHCTICGEKGFFWDDSNICLPFSDSEWRCKGCFAANPIAALFCRTCGRAGTFPLRDDVQKYYSETGIQCLHSRTPAASAQNDVEEFQNVTVAAWFYIIMLLTVVTGLFLRVHHLSRNPVKLDFIVTAALYSVVFLGAVWHHRLIRSLLGPPRNGWLISLLTVLIAPPLTVFLAESQIYVFPYLQKHWATYSDDFIKAGYGWGTIVFMIAVCPALFEEIAFRGIILHRLLKVMPAGAAVVVTAMMFAILHINVLGFWFYLVPMALIAGWLTCRARSILPAILLHFLHNSIVLYTEWSKISGSS